MAGGGGGGNSGGSVTCDKETGGNCHGQPGGEGPLRLGNIMGLQRTGDDGGDSHALKIAERRFIIRNQQRLIKFKHNCLPYGWRCSF